MMETIVCVRARAFSICKCACCACKRRVAAVSSRYPYIMLGSAME